MEKKVAFAFVYRNRYSALLLALDYTRSKKRVDR
jgi:hypothetical protein